MIKEIANWGFQGVSNRAMMTTIQTQATTFRRRELRAHTWTIAGSGPWRSPNIFRPDGQRPPGLRVNAGVPSGMSPGDGGRNRRRCLSLTDLPGQLRHDLEQVADDAVVAGLEHRRLVVQVDREDLFALLHPREVLYRAGDADRDVQLRPDRPPRLTDLIVLRHPPRVHGLARPRHGPAEFLRELLEQAEVLRVAEAAAPGHSRLRPPHP